MSSKSLYKSLRGQLPAYAQAFWDNKIDYFSAASKKKSFYYYGTSGAVAWILSRHLLKENKPLRNHIYDLLDTTNLNEQREIYQNLEPKLWGKFTSWIVKQPFLLTMMGVPRPQIRLMQQEYSNGVQGYIMEKLRHVLTEVLFKDNYFWRVYLTGTYTHDCCPNYLKEENFETLQTRCERIQCYNTTVNGFLKAHPDEYSHYILLDHQDWLAWHAPHILNEEWKLILQNSSPGCKVLMRSASPGIDFIPSLITQNLKFHDTLTKQLHTTDRVGTYASLHFAEVL